MFLIAVDCLMVNKKDIGYANEKIAKLSERIKKYENATLSILAKSKRLYYQSDNTVFFSGKEYGDFYKNINLIFNKNKYGDFLFLDITHDLTNENIDFLLNLKSHFKLTKLLYLNSKIKISYHLSVSNDGYRSVNCIDLLAFNHEYYCNTYNPLTNEFIDLAELHKANDAFRFVKESKKEDAQKINKYKSFSTSKISDEISKIYYQSDFIYKTTVSPKSTNYTFGIDNVTQDGGPQPFQSPPASPPPPPGSPPPPDIKSTVKPWYITDNKSMQLTDLYPSLETDL